MEKYIYINKMFTGGFIDERTGNIGHEIINCYKDDNYNQNIYITQSGGIGKSLNKKIKYLILVEKTSEGQDKVKIKYIAKLNPENQIYNLGDGRLSKNTYLATNVIINNSNREFIRKNLDEYFNKGFIIGNVKLSSPRKKIDKFKFDKETIKNSKLKKYNTENWKKNIKLYSARKFILKKLVCLNENDKKIWKEHCNQADKIMYGKMKVSDIFKNNIGNQTAIYYSFTLKEKDNENYYKPKDDWYIVFNAEKTYLERKDRTLYIKKGNNKSLPRQKLTISNKEKDYYVPIEESIKIIIENSVSNPNSTVEEAKININNNLIKNKSNTFLNFIYKENEEQIFTNLLYRYLTYNNLFIEFEKENFLTENKIFKNYDEKYNIYREVDFQRAKNILNIRNTNTYWKNGRIDLLVVGNKNLIIIENKIKSNLNGKYQIDNNSYSQLNTYYNFIKEIQNMEKHLLIFVPDYKKGELEKDLKVRYVEKKEIIVYSKLYEFFNKNKRKFQNDDAESFYFNEFMNSLHKHTLNTENRMTSEFIDAIYKL